MANDQATKNGKDRAEKPEKQEALNTISATVEPTDYEAPTSDRWWLGLTDDAPCEYLHIGAWTFPRESRRYVEDQGPASQVQEERYPGRIDYLTAEDVAAIAQSVRKLGLDVVRSEDGRVMRTRAGRLVHGMEPAGWYAYARKLEDGEWPHRGMPKPAPIVARPAEMTKV